LSRPDDLGNTQWIMTTPPPKPTREDRLAAKLRENLHRRKAQARALDAATVPTLPNGESNG